MPYLMQRAAQGMITQKALVYEADRMGLGVSDEELRAYLHQGQMGQMIFPGGNFIGQQAYRRFHSEPVQHGRAAVRARGESLRSHSENCWR